MEKDMLKKSIKNKHESHSRGERSNFKSDLLVGKNKVIEISGN
jgi:hypothetical protein